MKSFPIYLVGVAILGVTLTFALRQESLLFSTLLFAELCLLLAVWLFDSGLITGFDIRFFRARAKFIRDTASEVSAKAEEVARHAKEIEQLHQELQSLRDTLNAEIQKAQETADQTRSLVHYTMGAT